MDSQLVRAVVAAHEAPDLDAAARVLRDALVEAAGFDRCGVWLHDGGFLRGTWGTDRHGAPRDERHFRYPVQQFRAEFQPAIAGEVARVALRTSYVREPGLDMLTDGAPIDNAALSLRAKGRPVGVAFVDNWLTRCSISHEQLDALAPFCDCIALALAHAQERAALEQRLSLQRRFAEISSSVAASLDLSSVLRQARDGVAALTEFDHVGVFCIQDGVIRGIWRAGRDVDTASEREVSLPISGWPADLSPLLAGHERLLLADCAPGAWGEPASPAVVQHVLIALHDGSEVAGFLCVDNGASGQPVTDADVEPLLAFAPALGIAIRNAALFDGLSRTRQALLAEERFKAIGELAEGIAHHANNMLTGILGFAQLIQERSQEPATVEGYAALIERAASEGAQIVRRLDRFRRFASGAPAAGTVNLVPIVRDAIQATLQARNEEQAAGGAAIEVVDELGEQTLAIGVAADLREVFASLAANAFDAMPSGGVLRVSSEALGDGRVAIEVADNGVGMDAVTRLRAFEPFFTTKQGGPGRGLGLFTARTVVRRSGGEIEVRSTPGEGSSFRVMLPSAQEAASEGSPMAASGALRGLHVLVAADTAGSAETLASGLRAEGAQVSAVTDVVEALQWLDSLEPERGAVVVCDGFAKGAGGAFLSFVRDFRPSVGRVLVAGMSADHAGDFGASAADVILGAPVRSEALRAALVELCLRPPRG